MSYQLQCPFCSAIFMVDIKSWEHIFNAHVELALEKKIAGRREAIEEEKSRLAAEKHAFTELKLQHDAFLQETLSQTIEAGIKKMELKTSEIFETMMTSLHEENERRKAENVHLLQEVLELMKKAWALNLSQRDADQEV